LKEAVDEKTSELSADVRHTVLVVYRTLERRQLDGERQ
jgi:hypothetical protein